MVNHPEKMPNLNMVICRVYICHRKKTPGQRTKKIWFPPQSWWFPSQKHGTSLVMVRFMKGVQDDISQTFSIFYQGMVRSYHGTMRGIMFFKYLFHFFYSWKPNKQTFVVDYCHTFHRNICPFLVKGMRISKWHKHGFLGHSCGPFHPSIVWTWIMRINA